MRVILRGNVMSCENISTRKLDYYVNNPQAVIIDLRSESDYKSRHIANAINISFEEMEKKLEQEQGNYITIAGKKYGREHIFVVYCDRGSKSLMICSKLASRGYQVKTVVGGISQYHGKYLVMSMP